MIYCHDQRRAGRRDRPAEVGGQLHIAHLAAAAFGVVVGMPPLAVRPDRAGVVDLAAQLAGVLDHHVHAVGIALAEVAAGGVVRPRAAELDDARGDVVAALARLAKAVRLELHQGGEGEGVVGAGDVDLVRPDAGVRPQDVLGVVAGDGRDRPVLVVHVEPRLADPPGDRLDHRRRVFAIASAIQAGDDDAGRVVGLDAAIEQVQRRADHPRVDHVLHRIALLVIGLRVVGGVLGVHHLDVGDLFRRGGVVVHVAQEGRREHLPGALPTIGAVVDQVAGDRRRRAGADAADPDLGVAVHRAEDRHRVAHAGLDHADRDADQRLGRGAAAVHVREKIQPDAEIAGDEGREGRIVA